jgi:hypothetical protein
MRLSRFCKLGKTHLHVHVDTCTNAVMFTHAIHSTSIMLYRVRVGVMSQSKDCEKNDHTVYNNGQMVVMIA